MVRSSTRGPASGSARVAATRIIVLDHEDRDRWEGHIDFDDRIYEQVDVLLRVERRPVIMQRIVRKPDTPLAEQLRSELPSEINWRLDDRDRPSGDEKLPHATVVVASAFQRQPEIQECVESLRHLDYPDFDIVVVDNRKTARTEDAAELLSGVGSGPRVKVVHEPITGGSAARNRGLREATGPIVAFTDDDVIADASWLRCLVHGLLGNPAADCVTGMVLPREIVTTAQMQFEEFFGGFNRRLSPATFGAPEDAEDALFPYAPGRFGTGANMAFRTERLRALGGFDVALGPGTRARGGEELAVFLRLLDGKSQLSVEPAAIVYHRHRETVGELHKQIRGYGIGLTAMYTSLVLSDPRHLLEIGRRFPRAIALLVRSSNGTVRKPTHDAIKLPARLRAEHLLGMVSGPVAYLRSRADFR